MSNMCFNRSNGYIQLFGNLLVPVHFDPTQVKYISTALGQFVQNGFKFTLQIISQKSILHVVSTGLKPRI